MAVRGGLNKAKVDFIESDMFGNMYGKCSVIVCNPPYIETEVIDTLDDSVKKYEPRLALDGGKDGLNFYRILAEKAPKHLTVTTKAKRLKNCWKKSLT